MTGRGELVGGLIGLVSGDDGGLDGGQVGGDDGKLVGGDVEKLVGRLVGEIIRGRVGGLVNGVVRLAALSSGSVVSWSVVMWEDWSGETGRWTGRRADGRSGQRR